MNSTEYEAMYRVEDTLWWYAGMRRISAAVLGAPPPAGAAILDAGCGTGGNLVWLNGVGRGYGIDLSPLAAGFCAKRRLTRVSRASILALPFAGARFDLVTSFDVIYHLNVADDVAALREFFRVLKPGGRALVRVPALEFLRSAHDAAVHTRQRYSLDELRRKMEAAGFAVDRATYANSLLFPLAAAARLAARGRGAAGDTAHASDVKPVLPLVNAVCGRIMAAEAAVLGRTDLPVGLSAIAVGSKPR